MKDKSEAPCLFVYEDDDTELIPSLQSVVSRQRQLADRVIVKTAKTIKRERTVNPARVTATRPTKIRWQSVKSGVAMRSRGAVRPRPATKGNSCSHSYRQGIQFKGSFLDNTRFNCGFGFFGWIPLKDNRWRADHRHLPLARNFVVKPVSLRRTIRVNHTFLNTRWGFTHQTVI